MKLGIAGYGYVGQAHEDALKGYHEIIVSDPYKKMYGNLKYADAVIVCVSTPQHESGACNINNVYDVISEVDADVPILIKSTISLDGWVYIKDQFPYHKLTFSPEFLTAANALQDFKDNDTILLGGDNTGFWSDIFVTAMGKINISIATPEELILTKYFRNSYLAAKVTFFNQIYDLCENTGVDYEMVRKLVTHDPRIGESHSMVSAERGYGGHCFPKDVKAIIHTADKYKTDMGILKHIDSYNMAIRKTK